MSERRAALSAKDFKKSLAEMAESFRQKIDLEVDAFPVDNKARAQRIAKVADPETGYRFFAETYFPHYLTSPPSKLHLDLYANLPLIVLDENGRRELITAPRGSAKSTHVSLIFPLWCIVLGLKHYIMLIMDAFEQAAVMIEALKAELENNPRLTYDFPEICGQGRTWREGDLITRNNIKVEGFGTGKKLRGRRHGPFRPDLVILDDIENDENVESPKQRRKLENWVEKAVLKLGSADGRMDVLYAGTVLHFDAVIVRFAKKPRWRVAEYQAVLQWPDRMDLWDQWEELYLNDGELAADAFYSAHAAMMNEGAVLNWPELHPLDYLMKERTGSHSAFESEYQNKPMSEDNPFRSLVYYVQMKRDWLHFGAIDPSLGKNNKNRDPSAILIAGFDRETQVLDVVEASIRKRLPDMIIEDAIALQRMYNCQAWFVETVQFQELLRTDLMKASAKAGLAMPCFPVTPIADKNLRIERLQPPVAAGLIRFNKAHQTLIEQLQQWPNAAHDDGPDCLEMLWTQTLSMAFTTLSATTISSAPLPSASPLGGYRL
ncbi:phage terminase large subunit [Pseudovibrio exalbescens]|uniref:phage terminase large subunit n=1 Tax=Pseudovibrio exalbescens TaxID=197461 RepID=UPI002365775C|nr:phage terminase large subunit [Pseudovibrio exalbescens]MDD7908625.1 phage terminase large subunit [Pseudovibrio exalbescens]